MLNLDELIEKSEKFLITLFCLTEGKIGQVIERDKIFSVIGVHDIDAYRQIIVYIDDKRLVGWTTNYNISISPKGKVEIKKLMDSTYIEREYKVLETIYELGDRKPEEGVMIDDLEIALEMSFQEINPILINLEERKHLIGSIEEAVWILPAGIEVIEKNMNNDYEKQEYLVMKTLVENYKNNIEMTRFELSKALSIQADDLFVFLMDFHKKNWIAMAMSEHGRVEALPAGVTAFHKWDKQNHPVTHVNTTNVHGTNFGNIQTGGQENIQKIKYTQTISHPDFNEAIKSISELIKDSSLSNFQKEDFLTDLERIKNLADNEPSVELVEHAKSKINYLDTALKATDLAIKVAPYFPHIYAFFEGLAK